MNDNPNKEFIDSEPINNREFVNKMNTEHQTQISNKNNKRKERNFDYEENSFRIPPPNPSSILNSTYLQTKEINTNEVLHKKIERVEPSKKLTNINPVNTINNLDKSAAQIKKLSKNKDKDSRFAKILIENYPSLTKNVNNIVQCMEHLSKQAAAQINELDLRDKLLPYARYQQLMQFLRVCAYESMGLK